MLGNPRQKMFGEYGIYSDGKLYGRVCDNRLFIKTTKTGREFIGEPTEASSYPEPKLKNENPRILIRLFL